MSTNTPEPLKPFLQLPEGERLKLAAPLSCEVVIKHGSQRTGGALTMGIQTLQPGGTLPTHRLLDRDLVWFVHKGQGRATVDGRSMTVVPGITVVVPRQSWYSLRNTGTGLLQLAWTAVPGGIESFYAALAQDNGPLASATLEAIGRQHGIEFRAGGETEQAGEIVRQGTRRHRRGRGTRGGRGARGKPEQGGSPAATPALPDAAPVSTHVSGEPHAPHVPRGGITPPVGAGSPGDPGAASSRRRRRRHRGPRRAQQAAPTAQPPSAHIQVQPPAASAPAPMPARGAASRPEAKPARPPRAVSRDRAGRGSAHHRRGRFKEVYMGGRWVRVSGDGPVVAGESESRSLKPDEDS